MDIHVRSLLTCKDIKQEDEENITYYNVFTKYYVKELPIKVDNIYLICSIQVSLEEDVECYLISSTPTGEQIGKAYPLLLKAKGDKYLAQYYIKFRNFPLNTEGEYTFVIQYQDKIMNSHSIFVEIGGE